MECYIPLCRAECLSSTNAAVGSCVALRKVNTALQSVFRHHSFRPGQLESFLPALHGRDVFVRMATGAGKSLAMFLVPLSYSDRTVGVIISPLNSLMDEQINLK